MYHLKNLFVAGFYLLMINTLGSKGLCVFFVLFLFVVVFGVVGTFFCFTDSSIPVADFFFSFSSLCVCACVCVFERERGWRGGCVGSACVCVSVCVRRRQCVSGWCALMRQCRVPKTVCVACARVCVVSSVESSYLGPT